MSAVSRIVPAEPTEAMVDAPRHFILYCYTPGRSLEGARDHMKSCGVSIDTWPKWAKEDTGHITKAAVAIIIWHMMVGAGDRKRHHVDKDHRICDHDREAFVEDCGLCDLAGTNWAKAE